LQRAGAVKGAPFVRGEALPLTASDRCGTIQNQGKGADTLPRGFQRGYQASPRRPLQYPEQMTAAEERPNDVFPSAALCSLPETRVRGLDFEKQAFIGPAVWLSSTSRWGCGYRCDGTASGLSVGRFNTPDPSNGTATAPSNPSVPQSWNRFAYADSDPINNNDPTGLDTCFFDDDGQLDCFPDSTGYCPPEYQICDDPFPGDPGSPSPPPPPSISVPVNFGDGQTGTLTLAPGSQYATLGFADPADAGAIAAGVCVVIEPCGVDVAVVGGAIVAVTVALNQIGALITDITDIIISQVRRMITAVASCSVHEDGTPDHASAGRVKGTGRGANFYAARQAAFSAAQANVFAEYGVGFHAQHCQYTYSR